MDLITQGLLGATLAQAVAKKNETRVATTAGFFSGMLADADALIISSQDPLLTLEFHRHFSHSLIFIPIGALIAATLLWPFFKKHIAFKRLYFFSFLAYATSGVLDACTSYGTHLLWPFSDERIAWNLISIVDPVFSLILIIAIIIGIKKLKPLSGQLGIVLAISYMLFATSQHSRAVEEATKMIEARGDKFKNLTVKPTMANQVLWRSIYEADGVFHVDAVRIGLFAEAKIYPGEKIEKLDLSRDFPALSKDDILYKDALRFTEFSNHYVARHPEHPHIIGDVRYSMLPIGILPLWGIELNVSPGQHAKFNNYRDTSQETRNAFMKMLLGKELDE